MPASKQQTIIFILLQLLCGGSALAAWSASDELGDLYFGEALFYAFQEDYFSAITRLDIELAQHYELDQPGLDSLAQHRTEAEFDVGDLELHYRMHQRAGRAIERVLNAKSVPQQVRNAAAYRLARIYYEKGSYINTIHALDLIRDDAEKPLKRQADMLRAQAHMTQRNFDQAIKLLQPIRNAEEVLGYASYNLGIAYLHAELLDKGISQLDQVGQLAGNKGEIVALRDKANLTLGNRLLEEGQPEMARPYLERVRLDGPFSNKALLWAGWADAALNNYENALVPWTVLHERDASDAAVQEALLAVPYAYTQLEVYSQAALLYGQAVNAFDKEIERLDSSISSILNGKLKQTLLQGAEESNTEFIENLRRMKDAPETRYLLQLMASHDFQESVKNFRDIERLRLNSNRWLNNIIAYQDLIEVRKRYYKPLLPSIEREYKTLDSLMKSVLLRRDAVARRRVNAQRARNIQAFATQNELAVKRRLDRLQYRMSRLKPQAGLKQAKARAGRLQGVLSWQMEADYDQRLQTSYQHLKELDEVIKKLQAQHQVVTTMKREAYQSFEGYLVPFQRMSTQLRSLRDRAKAGLQQQARYLEKVAVRELDRRRKKLAEYRVKARFALAESYDRATKKRAEEAEEILRQQQSIQEIRVEDGDTKTDSQSSDTVVP